MNTTAAGNGIGLSDDASMGGAGQAGISTTEPQMHSNEASTGDLFAIFWRGKWLIVAMTLAMATASLVASLFAPKRYQATVLVAPVDMSQSAGRLTGVSSMLSNLGGLASLVGASTLSASKAVDIATLKSELLTTQYIRQNNLLPILFASQWDPRRDQWRTDDPKKIPALWDGSRYFVNRVCSVAEDETSGLYRVTVTWTNPEAAATWANGIVALANEYLRNKAISEANANIAYLQEQAKQTSTADLKVAILDLMEQEIRSAMIAQGQSEYALQVVDPAFVPKRPYSPSLVLWTVTGFLAGLLSSLGIVLLKARQTVLLAQRR